MKKQLQPKDITLQQAEEIVNKSVRIICSYYPNINARIREILTIEGLCTFFDALEQFDPAFDFRFENFIYKHIRSRLMFMANMLLEESEEYDEEGFTVFHNETQTPTLMTENKIFIEEVISRNRNILTEVEVYILKQFYFNSKTLAQIRQELKLSEYHISRRIKLIIEKLRKSL